MKILSGRPNLEKTAKFAFSNTKDGSIMISADAELPPQAILVDKKFDIIYVGREAASLLSYRAGAASSNLLKVIVPALLPALKIGLSLARRENKSSHFKQLPVIENNKKAFFDLKICRAAIGGADNFLAIFEKSERAVKGEDESLSLSGSEKDLIIREFSEELENSRRELLESRRQHAAMVEEFQTANEELTVANEELRRANQKVETSKRELSLANYRLKDKIAEITFINSDLQNLMATTDIATIFLDRDFKIVRCSPSAEKLFNIISADLGRSFDNFSERLDYKNLKADAAQVFESLEPVEREITDSGNRIYVARLQPYVTFDHRIIGTVLNFFDVTAQRHTEEALRKTEERLRVSQKMESIGRLVGGIAHDFNNMLTAILGNGNLALNQLPGKHPSRKNIENIIKAGDHSASFTRQLLAFSRRQMMQKKRASLNAVVNEAYVLLARLIGEDININLHLSGESLTVEIDPDQMTQVIINLIVNARDAMPGGGLISITSGWLEINQNRALPHDVIEPGEYAFLEIADTGRGMSGEILEKIFEPFYTTKLSGEGTGLGLSTVWGIVKQFGGYIDARSVPDKGSTFIIYLPKLDFQKPDFEAPAEIKDYVPTAGKSILVVDDEELVRNLVRTFLEDDGYRITAVSTGAEALALCQAEGRDYDLILTDVVMPGMSGEELAGKIQDINPHVKILYMSGYTDDVLVRHGVEKDSIDFIQKPFDLDELSEKVDAVLNS